MQEAIVRRLFKHCATGTYTKQQILQKATQWGLANRRGQLLSSQAIGMLLQNRLYIGIIDVLEFGVSDQRDDFEPPKQRSGDARFEAVGRYASK